MADTSALTLKEDPSIFKIIYGNKGLMTGLVILAVLSLIALFGPIFTESPTSINPMVRIKPPSADMWFGTDPLGRDIFARSVWGGRISLSVGVAVAVIAVGFGLVLGLLAGYIRVLDAIIMRVMDGLMAIPGILLAIALISLTGATLFTVIVAITIPEIPRVVRLVRSVVLTVREEAYVEAAIAAGTKLPSIMIRHILPNTIAPLIVQATYVCASAMLTESILGFLGAGIPPEIPSWGNIMSEGRTYFQLCPWIIFFPGVALGVTVMSVNIVGDGLRDTLDPRIAKKM
ncbi:MAG: ABC transporter permease [Rhodobacteraceae bacterium]|jgi:peptide/nickel transport system permease protein|nr:ABC transporter permease [Paracoccaceae bacterium]MBT4285542.1 ABC transporter permease [Paracoccaceae bacterium]MBT4778705.1 ABC transporter permease [Paracoccaceae bacterium]MBT7731142.1 ABC transporter permease [Rhodospirillaceae bacterium]MDG2372850.1 ABC transporter permease [Paracoccaceae bacterium]